MKLDARRIPGFLRDPGPMRVVLLHGEDEGLVRHRADELTLAVVGQRDDPFRIAWLAREEHSRLLEEATAIAMLGGRRVVRVRDAVDGLAHTIEQIVAGPGDSLVILEVGGALAGPLEAALPGRGLAGRGGDRLLSGGGQGAAGAPSAPAYRRRGSASRKTRWSGCWTGSAATGRSRAARSRSWCFMRVRSAGWVSRRSAPASVTPPQWRSTTRCSRRRSAMPNWPTARWNGRWPRGWRRWR